MVKNLINEIEQAMLGSLNNEQLAQLRKVLDYTFRNVVVTEKDSVNTESNNQILVNNFISAKKVEGCWQCFCKLYYYEENCCSA